MTEIMVVHIRLEEYMKSSKWKGKIFMQDEKTCFKDGFEDGFNMAYKELELFEKENKELKAQIEEMKCCFNCDRPIKHHDCGDCHNGSNWKLAESDRLIRS